MTSAAGGWLLFGLSAFLVLDALLATALGKRYLLWCLKYMPAGYGRFIAKLYEGSKTILWIFILGELLLGIGLFWVARTMMLVYSPF